MKPCRACGQLYDEAAVPPTLRYRYDVAGAGTGTVWARDRPLCPACFDKEGRLAAVAFGKCPYCGEEFCRCEQPDCLSLNRARLEKREAPRD